MSDCPPSSEVRVAQLDQIYRFILYVCTYFIINKKQISYVLISMSFGYHPQKIENIYITTIIACLFGQSSLISRLVQSYIRLISLLIHKFHENRII